MIVTSWKVKGIFKADAQKVSEEIAGYKNGSVIPNAKNLIKIADYFGVSTDYLLGREGYEME